MADALASAMRKRLGALPESKPYTFSRVPAYIREINQKLYVPMVIAIGPYHHGREHLQATEDHKWRYLRDLQSRFTVLDNLEIWLRRMKDSEQDARQCYSESIALTSDEFVKMMVVDACFIIEYFLKLREGYLTSNNVGWGLQFIFWDLLLLENQIPFFIIEDLSRFVNQDAVELIRFIFQKNSLLKLHNPGLPPPQEIHHLLHLYHHWFVPALKPSHRRTSERSSKPTFLIPSATELRNAGVSFREKASPDHMLDITFRNGVMEIPFNQIGDSTRPIFTNLVAFEQSMLHGPRSMTTFSVLMDSLINTEKDVAILCQCGVVQNLLGSDAELALFFNDLCQYTPIDLENHYLAEMFREVNRYRDSRWHRNRETLLRDYFGSPWSIISFVAAFLIFSLTTLQTAYTIHDHHHPHG